MKTVTTSKENEKSLFPSIIAFRTCCLLGMALLIACSFDYGAGTGLENTRPDIVMENIEYVRVRKGDMLARFQAEHAERWEELQIMELRSFTFEQMEDHGETVNVEGAAKAATVQIDTGDISLSGGVRISIESEDVIINTAELEWKDKEKTIKGGAEEEVDVKRSDGTTFTGKGFSADIRSRAWSFTGEVKGRYVEKDENK
jgi:LPS export ABC transporter protein LptC